MSANFTEAPASVNFRATNGNGFTVQFTMRNSEMSELVKRVDHLTAHLLSTGWTPQGNGYKGSGQAKASGTGNGQAEICPIHHVAMKRREKNGDVWHSHKAINPDTGQEYWCRGKAK